LLKMDDENQNENKKKPEGRGNFPRMKGMI